MTDPHRQEPSTDEEGSGRLPAPNKETPQDADAQPGSAAAGEEPTAGAGPGETQAPEPLTGATQANESPAGMTQAGEVPTGEVATGEIPTGEAPTTVAPAGEAPTDGAVAADAPTSDAPAGDAPVDPKPGRTALLTGIAIGVLGIVVAVLAVTAYAWPGFLTGPGDPADVGSRSVAALAAGDGPALEALTCKGPDGAAVSALPPEALQLIQGARQTGPLTLLLDTQAQIPVTLTLTAQGQGQTQDLPAGLLLGVTGGDWCLTGLSQPQSS
jgi:hypothetical protein